MIALQRDELKQMLDSGESFSLINVLDSEQFEKAHIPGSINVPVKSKNFVQDVEQMVEQLVGLVDREDMIKWLSLNRYDRGGQLFPGR